MTEVWGAALFIALFFLLMVWVGLEARMKYKEKKEVRKIIERYRRRIEK